jgi:hypothetical protein
MTNTPIQIAEHAPSRPIQRELSRESNLSPKIERLGARRNGAAKRPSGATPDWPENLNQFYQPVVPEPMTCSKDFAYLGMLDYRADNSKQLQDDDTEDNKERLPSRIEGAF